MSNIKKYIKAFLREVLGLDVHRSGDSFESVVEMNSRLLVSSLQYFGIDLVLDVGANRGQFAAEIRRHGYAGKIVSFEPLSDAHVQLQQVSKADSMWQICPRCALGDYDGVVEINIAGNSDSSSILPMLESHRSAAPESAYQGKEPVQIKTLDEIAGQFLQEARAPFLKIDTQGFEWHVLDGARNTLPKIRGVLVELSMVPLYEGQHLWREVMARLEAEGFTLWALQPVFFDQSNGRTLQMDGIFYRNQ